MIVKICGITNRGDALAGVDAGVSALGFNFYPCSPRYIEPEAAADLIRLLPAAIWKVGVFVNEAPERVAELVRRIGLDVAQLHGDELPRSAPVGIRVWKALRMHDSFDAAVMEAYQVEAFVLDAASGDLYGGTGMTFDWGRASGLGKKVILAGGLDAGNVREAIRRARPWGVDACSRLEHAPGRKDHEKMRAFVEAARTEAAE